MSSITTRTSRTARRLSSLTLLLTAVAVASSSAFAGDKPNDRDMSESDYPYESEYRGDDYNVAERAGKAAGTRELRRGARYEVGLAYTRIKLAQIRVVRELSSDPRYVAAHQQFEQTREAYHARADQLRDTFYSDPAYRDVMGKAAYVKQELEAARNDPQLGPNYVARLAQLHLAIASRLSEYEDIIFDADPQLVALRSDYRNAATQLRGIEARLNEQIRSHPAIASAVDSYHHARRDLTAARADAASASAEYRTARDQYIADRNAYSAYAYEPYGYNPRGYVVPPTYGYYGGGAYSGYHHGLHYGHGRGVSISPFGGTLIKAR